MNLTLLKPSGFLLALITMLSCGFGATSAFAQADAAHEKCLKATDYKGCIESQGLSLKNEQLITGILWGTAESKSDGYSKQSIQGDAARQAPIIYSKLCNKKGK
jgi:hypothetical protein